MSENIQMSGAVARVVEPTARYLLKNLTPLIPFPTFYEAGPKIGISGIVYQSDGRTPAKDVVMYVYHMDQQGKYSTKGHKAGRGKRNGYIHEWVKTDQSGGYQLYTLVPASYPDSRDPKYIHAVVKESDQDEYYINEFLFDDDPFLTREARNNSHARWHYENLFQRWYAKEHPGILFPV